MNCQSLVADRIAILGGIDNDSLTRRPAVEVAAHARALIAAAPIGYALGSGNQLTSAMPNADVDALLAAGREVIAVDSRPWSGPATASVGSHRRG